MGRKPRASTSCCLLLWWSGALVAVSTPWGPKGKHGLWWEPSNPTSPGSCKVSPLLKSTKRKSLSCCTPETSPISPYLSAFPIDFLIVGGIQTSFPKPCTGLSCSMQMHTFCVNTQLPSEISSYASGTWWHTSMPTVFPCRRSGWTSSNATSWAYVKCPPFQPSWQNTCLPLGWKLASWSSIKMIGRVCFLEDTADL
ncbi:hypothetical protein SDC9_124538 [bioreactor metagenome]|uniref:Uncharacterized protein n=1 Tax=bioreactor metagenome TaxID=1076179 RepID=A0A645CL95_9ZZZZ